MAKNHTGSKSEPTQAEQTPVAETTQAETTQAEHSQDAATAQAAPVLTGREKLVADVIAAKANQKAVIMDDNATNVEIMKAGVATNRAITELEKFDSNERSAKEQAILAEKREAARTEFMQTIASFVTFDAGEYDSIDAADAVYLPLKEKVYGYADKIAGVTVSAPKPKAADAATGETKTKTGGTMQTALEMYLAAAGNVAHTNHTEFVNEKREARKSVIAQGINDGTLGNAITTWERANGFRPMK